MLVGDTIYADYQASTPVDPRVLEAMVDAEQNLFANPHAADHILGWRAAAAVQKASDTVASYFGFSTDELLFTSGASEANSMAIAAAKEIAAETGRRRILFGEGDHKSVINEIERSGLEAECLPLSEDGSISAEGLKTVINTDVCMLSVVGVNNENGSVADLATIADVCSDASVVLHVDMAQAPLAMTVDLFDLGVSFATVSSHKVYGPKGIGALLFDGTAARWLRPLILGGGQQNGLRGGTIATPLCVGFARAIEIIGDEGDDERLRVRSLRDAFIDDIERLGIGSLVGGREHRHPGNALIRFPGWEASDLLGRLQPTVAAASQSACSTGEIEASHVLTAMGMSAIKANECVRFSFGRFTDEAQISQLVAAISKALTKDAIIGAQKVDEST